MPLNLKLTIFPINLQKLNPKFFFTSTSRISLWYSMVVGTPVHKEGNPIDSAPLTNINLQKSITRNIHPKRNKIIDKLARLPVIIVSSSALLIRSIAFSLVGAHTISYNNNHQHINELLSWLSNLHGKYSNYFMNMIWKSILPNFWVNRIILQTANPNPHKNFMWF